MTQTTIRLINWNTQADKNSVAKQQEIQQILRQFNPDIICLTEAHPDYFPTDTEHTHLIRSRPGIIEEWQGIKRKVMLWSKWGWSEVDAIGSVNLPEGRYLHAVTTPPGCKPLHVVGVCVPYSHYLLHRNEGHDAWEGHKQYTKVLKRLLASLKICAIVAGDFNMPFYNKSRQMADEKKHSQKLLLDALTDYRIVTKYMADSDSMKPLIDHIALTSDLHTSNLQAVGRFGLSDHPLTVAHIHLP